MDTLEQIALETRSAVEELLDAAGMKAGDLLVVGCSSSEVCGGTIGHASSPETGKVIAQTILTACRERGVYLAAQCCEHLNRALIVEREAAEKFGYEPVEHVRAKAGLDIGGTLIGMHLKEVAVPLRLQTKKVGEAPISAAKTRPKLIGGVRAVYPEVIR